MESKHEARRLDTADPCLEYFDPLTKQLCKRCDDSNLQFELFILSLNIVHCAVFNRDGFVYSGDDCFIPDIRYYADAMPNVINILSYYYD